MKPQDIKNFKQKALQWANTFEVCTYLNSNGYSDRYAKYDLLLAAGASAMVKMDAGNAFEELKSFYNEKKTWLFGLLNYDLKNEIEHLHSGNSDGLSFPDLIFFVPQYLIAVKDMEVEVIIGDSAILLEIDQVILQQHTVQHIDIQSKLSKQKYIKGVEALKQHILKGDIYEVNFCQEFFSENATLDPLAVYHRLNQISPTPFSAFFKANNQYVLSASPERFLCKRGDKLVSQPIKGTAKRSSRYEEDLGIKMQLQQDAKEQAENVMIVDLVRNDLTRSAVRGSVRVEELFGIYAFPQVYQMISTISCQIHPELHIIDAIKNTFPMGSMTGAPKIKAMELIEQYEQSRRGVYSGAMGYISPDEDFDFNVIIRSICYNAESKYLSFQVGGAITFASDPEKEYEECLLKASAIMQTLQNK